MNKDKLHVDVLRLFDGSQYQEDWHSMGSSGYTTQDIEKIIDPASGTKKEITSIPSPFARINLFEHAFKAVNSAAKTELTSLGGNTMFHKLVSECLDVGQIFFNYENYQENKDLDLDIVSWNKQHNLRELQDSNLDKHRLLGDTLALFINQDREGSSFDKVDNIHLLRCNYRIVGGTSPSTLFFGGYNDRYVLSHLGIKAGNDTLFDEEFYPLHMREFSYQRYLHGLFKVYPQLQRQMPIFFDHLKQSLRLMEQYNRGYYKDLQDFLKNPKYTDDTFEREFETLNGGDANQIIDIASSIYLRQKGEIVVDSDFAIHSDFPENRINDKTPLVLVNGFQKKLNYYNGIWDPATDVPYAPTDAPEDRILPGQTDKYPYLTVSDFLEPYLIELEFKINNRSFFDGNPIGFSMGNQADVVAPDFSYLLPLKPMFFRFFGVESLKGLASDGKPMLRMKKIGSDSVSVELRIPIANEECIVLERIYRSNTKPNEVKNEGGIVRYEFNMGFLPLVKGAKSFYQQVGLVDSDIFGEHQRNEYDLIFLRQGAPLPVSPTRVIKKSNKNLHSRNATTKYFILEEEYDVVVVDSTNARGIIVPDFQKVSAGGKSYTFAVDFGTTNTHIEYTVDGAPPQPFNYGGDDAQLITLIEPDSEWYFNGITRDVFFHESIPTDIGPNEKYRFPIRTVSTEIENLNHNQPIHPIADINISFVYEKWWILKNSHIERNLKWQNFSNLGSGEASRKRLRAFLGELMILIRNKVIMNGGDLDRTRLIWFFPSSMDNFQLNHFSIIWTELFHTYITKNNEPIHYSEAVAPFYTHQQANAGSKPAASIDIGGGTTDFAIFVKNKPVIVSSAMFAGNSVWGDGFLDRPDVRNGIVRCFKGIVEKFLEDNKNEGLSQLAATYDQLIQDYRFSSSDLMSFFFSIDNNKDVISKGHRLNFAQKVAESQDFKIIFLLFYAGNIYYLARLMHMLGLEMPRYITLNGNGSKIINLLDNSKQFAEAVKFAKYIFERVYQKPYYEDGLSIEQSKEPKEATCKGGLRKDISGHEYDSLVWLGNGSSNDISFNEMPDPIKDGEYTAELGTVVNAERVKYPMNNLKYRSITPDIKEEVVAEYKNFLWLIKDANEQLNFKKLFGVKTELMDQYLATIRRDADDNISQGLNRRGNLTNDTETIIESMFFYPLTGGIYALMENIAESLGE